jgi:hypothetical protein
MAGADLDQLVQELHRQQRMTPLHNKETMVRIGNFTGATAGLFGAVHSTGRGSVGIQAELIDLSTSEVLASARAEIRKESALESAVDWLADQILATLTTAEIESPRDGAPCGRQITVKGHAKFVPETWRIWVTVAPSLNGHHYPQKRLSPEADGSWFSHSIYAGDEGNSRSQQQLFTLCVVLVDEQADERLGRAVGTDLQLDDFGDKHCRMLAHIDLSRSDDSVPTVANNHN